MIVPDVNVLVAAFRPDHPHHGPAAAAIEDARGRRDPMVLLDVIRLGVVRVVTNRRVFQVPDTADAALAYVAALAAAPFGAEDRPTETRWRRLHDMCATNGISGALVVDAYIAAAALDLGATVLSFDTDFARFRDLRWARPT